MSGCNNGEKKLLLFGSAFNNYQSQYFEHSVKPHIDKSICITVAKDPEEARKELSTGSYPLALLEHWLLCGFDHDKLVDSILSKKDSILRRLVRTLKSAGGIFAKAMPVTEVDKVRQYDAYKLLPGFIEASPSTKYIITSHSKGSGIGKDKTFYDPYPQVLKTMGWLNTKANAEYVIRKIRDIYLT